MTTIADRSELVALSALAWTLADDDRAGRLLSITGLSPESIRARATEPALLAAVLSFLEAHEPDLIGCAAAIGSTPTALVQARMVLEG